MRAGFGLVGILVALGIVALLIGKGMYSGVSSKPVIKAREDANQLAGNARDGSMSFKESITLRPETRDGKIVAINVTSISAGGPAETYFGLKEADAIVEILPLGPVKDQINSQEDANAFVQEAYQRQQQLVVMRDGQRMTLPQAGKPASPGPSNPGNSNDALQQQIDSIGVRRGL